MADTLAQILQHELRDVEAPRRGERRQPRRAHRLGHDRARHQLDRRGVEDAVIVGLPDAGRGDGGVLQDELHHLVGRLDVGQRLHHRRASIGLARRLQPAEADEGRDGEAAFGQHVRRLAAAAFQHGRVAVAAAGLRRHAFHDAERSVAGGVRRPGKAGAERGKPELAPPPDPVEPPFGPFLQHRLPERHGGEPEGRCGAERAFLEQQAARAEHHEVEQRLVHLDREAGAVQMALHRRRRLLQHLDRSGTGPGSRLEPDPALEGRRELRQQARGKLLGGIGRGRVIDARRPVRSVRQGEGRAVAPQRLPGAPRGFGAAIAFEQGLRIRGGCFGNHLSSLFVQLHTTPCSGFVK